MKATVVGKELIYEGDELHKSRVSLPVLDVVFEERAVDDEPVGWDVFAVTASSRYQIGAIYETGTWIGSRDLVVTDKGYQRLFMSIPSGASICKDKEDFISQWKGTHIFVYPSLPLEVNPGELRFVGGDSVLIEAWIQQSRVWMGLAIGASESGDIHYLNVAYIMAGYATELLFKAFAWTEGGDVLRVHNIGSLYGNISHTNQRRITSIVEEHGWNSTDEFVDYIDNYINPVNRRYFGIDTGKSFKGLNISKDHRLTSLARVHHSLCEVVGSLLVRTS